MCGKGQYVELKLGHRLPTATHCLFRASRLKQSLAAEVGKDICGELEDDGADLLVDEITVLLRWVLEDVLLEVP